MDGTGRDGITEPPHHKSTAHWAVLIIQNRVEDSIMFLKGNNLRRQDDKVLLTDEKEGWLGNRSLHIIHIFIIKESFLHRIPILKLDANPSCSSEGRGARNASLQSDLIISTSTLHFYFLNYKWETSQWHLSCRKTWKSIFQHPSNFNTSKALSCHTLSLSSLIRFSIVRIVISVSNVTSLHDCLFNCQNGKSNC